MNNFEDWCNELNAEAYHAGEYHWKEDGYEVYRSHPWTPPGCHDSCGCIFYLKDGKLEFVEGDPMSPYNHGKLCMRCLDMAEMTNHPDRLKYPMKRVGERGENKWERISWDEALDICCERINYFKSNYGPQSIAVVRGTGRDISWGAGVLAYMAIQTPFLDLMFNIGFSCYTPRTITSNAIMGDYWVADAAVGHPDRYSNSEWKVPGVVIIWGTEPLKSNADGYLGHWLVECVQLGTKIISVDPRLTWWGARADYFLQLRPGTDGALAMAMLNVITTEDLYDHEFVDAWCYGFDQMCQSVAESTPEWAAEICDLDPEDIRGAARLFATEGPGTIDWGLTLEQQPNSLGNNLGIISLLAICGYIDCPGGAVIVRDAYGFPHHMGENYCPSENIALLCQKVGPGAAWGETRMPFWEWEDHTPSRIRMAIFESCNTFGNATADPERIYNDMRDSLEFVVGIDPFLNPTLSALADILLPVAMSIEKDGIRAWWTPLRTTSKLTEYYEAKTDEDIAIMFLNRLQPDNNYGLTCCKDLQNWRLLGKDSFHDEGESTLDSREAEGTDDGEQVFRRDQNMHVLSKDRLPEGTDFDTLKTMGAVYDTFCDTYYKYEKGLLRDDGKPGFKTTTGRIELYSLAYTGWGAHPLPHHVEPPEGPVTTPELMEKYPLIMDSGVRSYEFFHGEHRNLKTMREFHPLPLVCMNQNVADRFGIKEGQWTWIENDRGRFRQIAHIVPTLKDYMISTEHGWWFPEEDPATPNLYRTFDSNSNVCIDVNKVGPYGIGSTTKNTLVTIYPCVEGDTLPTEQILELGGFPMARARVEECKAKWEAEGTTDN